MSDPPSGVTLDRAAGDATNIDGADDIAVPLVTFVFATDVRKVSKRSVRLPSVGVSRAPPCCRDEAHLVHSAHPVLRAN